jgi:hypothetical protein
MKMTTPNYLSAANLVGFIFILQVVPMFVNGLAIRHEPIVNTERHLCNEQQLSGNVVGDKHLLCDQPHDSTSGKSTICEAYRQCDEQPFGTPTGDPVVVKMSSQSDALQREAANYKKHKTTPTTVRTMTWILKICLCSCWTITNHSHKRKVYLLWKREPMS